MRRFLRDIRHFLRVTGVAAVFVLLTAFECYQTSSDIQYAQGYGYVISITCTYNCKTANTSTEFYLIFDTYDQAKAWLNRWNSGDRKNFAAGTTGAYGDSDSQYYKIKPLLQPVPVPFAPATPDLNTPQPYVPQ
jgi:hypothetical protein